MRRALFLAVLGPTLFFARPSRAADDEIEPPSTPASSKADTTYGRIAGDVGVVLGAGATFGPRDPRSTADLRFRYMETAGLFLTYEDGSLSGKGAEPLRVLAFGVEIRPLFMARWLTGRESGKPRFDLMLDSLAIELGGFLPQPEGGTFGDHPGMQAGLGFEIPILPRASGPWIGMHGGIRFSDTALGGDLPRGPDDRALYGAITLAWHQIVGVHVADVHDTAPR
jgi:hypothetical protein